ncbi:MAG: O-antigen ligase family protein [Trueperaceae bacterium]
MTSKAVKNLFLQRMILLFAVLYPFVFIPGARIWSINHWQDPIVQSNEIFQMLPKLFILFTVALLGFISVRPILWREPFIWFLLGSFVFICTGVMNSQDEFAFSFLGPSRRMDGLLYHIALTMWGVFTYHVAQKYPKQVIFSLFAGMLISGAIQGIIAIFQRLGLDIFSYLVRYQPYGIPVGTIGQPGMLAGLLLASLLSGLVLFTLAQSGSKNKLWIVIALVLTSAGLGVSTNRAALIALVVGMVGLNLARRSWKFLGLSILITLSIFSAKDLLPTTPGKTRDYVDASTFNTRKVIWQIAFEVAPHIRGFPFIGGGPDAFKLAQLRNPPLEKIEQAYRMEMAWSKDLEFEKVETVLEPGAPIRTKEIYFFVKPKPGEDSQINAYSFLIDKAHSFPIDRLLSYGIFSVLIWLVLYLYPVWWGWLSTDLLKSGFAWTLLAIFTYYLVWFPVIQVEPLHVSLLAAAWAVLKGSDITKNAEGSSVVRL